MAQQIAEQTFALFKAGKYAESLDVLKAIPLDVEASMSHGDRILLDIETARCYCLLGKWKLSFLLFNKIIATGMLPTSMLANVMFWQSRVYRGLRAYDDSLDLLQRVRDCRKDCGVLRVAEVRNTIEKAYHELLLLATRQSYAANSGTKDHRICHNCSHVALATCFIVCSCQRVWYCDEDCMEAESKVHQASHFHFRMPLDLLPTGVVQQHILPLCLGLPDPLTAHGTPYFKAVRDTVRFGLGLRTLSRKWCLHVNSCTSFWLDLVPFEWPAASKPGAECPAHVRVIALARTRSEWVLKMKHARAQTAITKTDQRLETLKRQLSAEESKKSGAEAALGVIDDRLKRLKQ